MPALNPPAATLPSKDNISINTITQENDQDIVSSMSASADNETIDASPTNVFAEGNKSVSTTSSTTSKCKMAKKDFSTQLKKLEEEKLVDLNPTACNSTTKERHKK